MPRSPISRPRLTKAWAATAATALVFGAGAAAVSLSPHAAAATAKLRILFDDSKAETAGNADWIVSTSKPDPLAQNPAPSKETDWTGALSSWGVALQKSGGYSLKTNTSTITYGNSSNAQDLSNFDELVLPEPNVLLSSAEKSAIMKFVQNGGGLFIIVDHNGSDRNNDGADSDKVVNDLMTNNGVDNTDPFGFSIDLKDISTDQPKAISDASNPVLHGPFGNVTGSVIYDGTTETLHPSDNPNVKGLVYITGATPGGTTGAFFTTSTFGSGRVAVWGDSSTIDDGTGESGKTLEDGWDDPGGTDAPLALNATAWLAGNGTGGGGGTGSPSATPTQPSPSPTQSQPAGSCGGGNLLANPGFETGSAAPWTASAKVIADSSKEPPHAGTWDAWLDGYGTTTTDTLAQSVSLPSGCSSYSFSFYLHIDTAETTTSTQYDTLKVQVVNSSGTVLGTLATYSNLNHNTGYAQKSFNLSAYAGQNVTLKFTGAEDSEEQTSFVVDDTSVTVS